MTPTIYHHNQFGDIRTAGTPDQPMFCLADLCRVLEIGNVTDTRKRLDPKGFDSIEVLTKGGKQTMYFVNEKNLYKVIMRSDKPQAEPFQDWVCGEVLPSIRKHGAYMTDSAIERTLTDPDYLIQLATALKEERTKRLAAEQQVLSLAADVASMQPKASYYDTILNNKSTVLITQIAQDYGMSAKAFNKILAGLRLQHKVNGQWILYSPYIGQGYVQSKAVEILRSNGRKEIKYNTEWTQKGRLFLYDTLKNNNIIPLIEQ